MGGIEICVVNLANSFAIRGYNVTLLCLLKDIELSEQIHKSIEVRFLTMFHRGGNSLLYKIVRRILSNIVLCKEIAGLKNSVIISTRNEYTVLLSRFFNKSNLNIAQLHHDYIGLKGIKNDFKYRYNNIDYFVLLTDDIRVEVERIMRGYNQHTKCVTIPNFLPDANPQAFSIERENIAVAVGRLAPEKGFMRLIDVWDIVQKELGDEYKLYIVGDGAERAKIQSKISKLGIQSSVKLLGQLSNVDALALMRKAKIYCMPSYTESFGMVLLEAMHSGLPQIAYDVRVGPRNLIQNEVTGFLIPDGDNKAFSSRIIQLFMDAERWENMSRACEKRVLQFAESNVISKWERIIINKTSSC